MAASLWKTDRLVFRAPTPSDDAFLTDLASDPVIVAQSGPMLLVPPSEDAGKQFREIMEKELLGVLICLPVTEEAASAASSDPKPDSGGDEKKANSRPKPKPIGFLTLSNAPPNLRHCRNSSIGISIAIEHTGKGYGTEAIEWALRWGFRSAGLHRIGIGAVEHNVGAVRLYSRLGFVQDGRRRNWWWYDGRFWDTIELSMLEDEWREREASRVKQLEQR